MPSTVLPPEPKAVSPEELQAAHARHAIFQGFCQRRATQHADNVAGGELRVNPKMSRRDFAALWTKAFDEAKAFLLTTGPAVEKAGS